MEIDSSTAMIGALIAGYPAMFAIGKAMYNDNKSIRKEFIDHLTSVKKTNYSRVSDIENRLAEIEHADD